MIKQLDIFLFVTLLLVLSLDLQALTFAEAVKNLHKHESVAYLRNKSKAAFENAKFKSSWGDPKFKLMAKNYPVDTFKNDQTPMTGIEFGLSQKIALTNKYGNIEKALQSMAKSYQHDANDKRELLIKMLWDVLILKRKFSDELDIINENKVWISKILKVSKKLYSTGKNSQQAILDIQIRKTEIDLEIINKQFELSRIDDNLKYLVSDSNIDPESIPWDLLNSKSKNLSDYKEFSLQEMVKAKEYNLNASHLNYIPDIMFSLGYTKRSNIDNKGDFIGASISFNLPLSGQKRSELERNVQEKYAAEVKYKNYKKNKIKEVSVLSKEIKKIENEIKILNDQTIKYARGLREITSKSYGLGNASYVELLQSELKLQKILLKEVNLKAKGDIKKVTLKYVKGESFEE